MRYISSHGQGGLWIWYSSGKSTGKTFVLGKEVLTEWEDLAEWIKEDSPHSNWMVEQKLQDGRGLMEGKQTCIPRWEWKKKKKVL